MSSAGWALVVGEVIAGGVLLLAQTPGRTADESFPHERHAKMFPFCSTCHAGVVAPGKSVWPDPAKCQSCHDGTIEKRVTWRPRTGPRANNLRFTHFMHDGAVTLKNPSDSTLIRNCSSCHVRSGTARMTVVNSVVAQCLGCHGLKEPHFDVPNKECARCHVRLADAPALTRQQIARFPKPRSHDSPDFISGGHGRLAMMMGATPREQGIAASCSTCHSRNLCITCHVNAAEVPTIQALALDDRPPVFLASLSRPASHTRPDFLRTHGRDAERGTCATCHSRESCLTCHVNPGVRAIAQLPRSGPGRAIGAQLTRLPPRNHTIEFRDHHASEASSRPQSCQTCHTRSFCLECHRPDGVGAQTRYHPANFLTRHPSAAYSRDANCSDCHNSAQFCQSCHKESGLVARGKIGTAGYHDAFRGFSLGHGQAARQNLESCASCHAERDCTACHSAVGGGFRFNPHGPNFNASRERVKNPSVCVACHGLAIPDSR